MTEREIARSIKRLTIRAIELDKKGKNSISIWGKVRGLEDKLAIILETKITEVI